MSTKLTVTFTLATSTLAATALAYDKPHTDVPPTDTIGTVDTGSSGGMADPFGSQSVGDKMNASESLLDQLWATEAGARAAAAIHFDEPILDEMDPGPRCTNIDAGKSFYMPLFSDTIGRVKFSVGFAGEAGIVADADRLGVKTSFAPAAELFGQVVKPMDLQLLASTDSAGVHSVDLGLYAFGTEIDSYNLADSSTPIEYVQSLALSLPNVLSGALGDGGIDCRIPVLLPSCSVVWDANASVMADVSAIIVVRVNSNGVEAHALAAANAHAAVTVGGTVDGVVDLPPVPGVGDPPPVPFTGDAGGTGVINVIRSLYTGRAVLAPYNAYWLADAEATVNIEDVLGAKVSISFEAGGEQETQTLFERESTGFTDAWRYQCTFAKQFE